MKELEKLLNSLIQRGWRPWGKYDKILNVSKNHGWLMRIVESNNVWMYVHIRSIVSLESWLWQFVCKNSLIKQCKGTICKNPKTYWNAWSIQWEWWYWCDIAEYRLLESALIPEEGLAKFLVENIDIKN